MIICRIKPTTYIGTKELEANTLLVYAWSFSTGGSVVQWISLQIGKFGIILIGASLSLGDHYVILTR